MPAVHRAGAHVALALQGLSLRHMGTDRHRADAAAAGIGHADCLPAAAPTSTAGTATAPRAVRPVRAIAAISPVPNSFTVERMQILGLHGR